MDVFHKHAWYALVDRIGPRLSAATFDNFEIRNQEQKKLVTELRGYTEKIAENRTAGVNVILLGTCGVGKDHLSFCIAREAHKAGCSVAWTNGEELFADARDSMDGPSTEAELVYEYTQPDFFWLSDPLPGGAGELTDWQKRLVYRIVDARYRMLRPMIVTANVTSQEEFRQRISQQVADRLLHGAKRWMCKWPSYRQLQSDEPKTK